MKRSRTGNAPKVDGVYEWRPFDGSDIVRFYKRDGPTWSVAVRGDPRVELAEWGYTTEPPIGVFTHHEPGRSGIVRESKKDLMSKAPLFGVEG